MISYRLATALDAENIASLHAESWKNSYSNILSSSYLQDEVANDRRKVWLERFMVSPTNQHVILAQQNDLLIGFVCVYLNYEYQYGSLIDNLHVKPQYKGQGLGKQLVNRASDIIFENCDTRSMHLWVYKDNSSAISFYEKIGGKKVEEALIKNPDGSSSICYRMFWETFLFEDLQ
jgi:ribosomal protein S18 acetylase RimI-like enzyme